MFKTKYTYLKTFDIVWDFDLAENDMNILKSMQAIVQPLQCTAGSQYKSHCHYWPSCAHCHDAEHPPGLGRNMCAKACSSPLLCSKLILSVIQFLYSLLS